MAAYSRLYAITLTYTRHDYSDDIVKPSVRPEEVGCQVEDVVDDNLHTVGLVANPGKDLGEKVERISPMLDHPPNQSKQLDQPVEGLTRKKKLRKKDAMDDIFGF